MIPIAVYALEGRGLAILVGVSFLGALRAREFGLLALVGAVGKLITFIALCNRLVFFYVGVVIGDDL